MFCGLYDNMRNMTTFSTWLQGEMISRRWNNSRLAEESGLSTSMISLLLNGERNPGAGACNAIARAFEIDPVIVFQAAGILKQTGPLDAKRTQLIHDATHLDDERLDHLSRFAEFLRGSKK